MKKISAIVLLISFAVNAFAGKGIVVEQKLVTEHSGASIGVTWYVSDNGCKMKLTFGDDKVKNSTTYFIPNTQTGSLYMYNDAAVPAGVNKTYYSTPVSSITADKIKDGSSLTVTKTGETKEIGGFTCEKIIITTTTTETETWVTKDFKPDFYKYYAYFRNSYELAGLSQEKIKGVPLQSVTKDLSGKVISQTNFVSATKTDLKETEFTVPSDYVAAPQKN